MTTDKTQARPRYCPAPVRHTVPVTTMNATPPPHPELEYEDEQRFRNYVWSIDFGDPNDAFKDQMFKQPTQLPQPETPRTAPPEELQRRVQDYPPVRGTGLGKGRGNGHPHRQRPLNVSHAEHEEAQIDSVRESPTSETKKVEGHSQEETGQGEDPNDEGNSSDDCAWSTDSDSEAEDIKTPAKVQGRSDRRKGGAGKRVPEKFTERDRSEKS